MGYYLWDVHTYSECLEQTKHPLSISVIWCTHSTALQEYAPTHPCFQLFLWYLLLQELRMEVRLGAGETLAGALKVTSRTNNTISLFPMVYSFWSNQCNNNICYYWALLGAIHHPKHIAFSVAQSRPTLCNPMDWSLSGSSIHGILWQEYWSGLLFPPPGDLPNPGINPPSPALQVDSLLLSHQECA